MTRGWPRGPAKRRRPECASAREPARSPSQAAAVAALRRTLAAAAPARRAPLRRLRQIARPPTPVSVAPALVSAAAGESEPSPVRLATLASAPDLVVSLPRVQPRGSLNSRRLFDRRTSRPRPRRSLRALTPSRERPARRASVGPRRRVRQASVGPLRPAGGEETRAAFARIWHRDCLPRRRRPSGSAARVALRLAQAGPAGRRAVAPHRNRKPRHPPSHRSPNHTAQRLRQCGRHRCRAGAPARRGAPSARAAGCVIRQRRLPPGRSPARRGWGSETEQKMAGCDRVLLSDTVALATLTFLGGGAMLRLLRQRSGRGGAQVRVSRLHAKPIPRHVLQRLRPLPQLRLCDRAAVRVRGAGGCTDTAQSPREVGKGKIAPPRGWARAAATARVCSGCAPAASHAAWPRPAPGGHADSCLPPHRRWKARQQCCCACRGA